LPVVFYGYETWSLTLREEQRLGVFENRVLRGMFGPMRDELTAGWRKLHKLKHLNPCSSTNIILMIKTLSYLLARYVARMKEKRNAYKIFVENPVKFVA
jgi:hypothetical protein